ncbi:DeoR/GlpR family DNA-binding transcription regulator [Niallia circulans]|uniref:DeoR/GlpR family DNA-binding transcription regulator n=1 Tax=Niallia circulans TaxID=1397 RepID=UPI0035121282
MSVMDRWKKITEIVNERELITVQELCEELKISEPTARRDLRFMEENNLIKRVPGGARSISKMRINEYSIDLRMSENIDAKRAIGKKAAEFIKDGDFIFLDSGSTAHFIIDYIQAADILVVTNSVQHVQKLAEKNIQTYLLDGYIRFESLTILGEETVEKLKTFNFDKAFIGVRGIDIKAGFTTVYPNDGELKKQAILQSYQPFILADDSKFNVKKFFSFAKLDKAEIITNKPQKDFLNHAKIIVGSQE